MSLSVFQEKNQRITNIKPKLAPLKYNNYGQTLFFLPNDENIGQIIGLIHIDSY